VSGIVLTFDDRHIGAWTAARPLFARHGARATFYVIETDLLDPAEQAGLRALAADGHSVGAHGLRHRDAPAYIAEHGAEAYVADEITPCVAGLEAAGLSPRGFAYPVSHRDEASDAVLLRHFDRLRGGAARTLDPVEARSAVVAADRIAETRVLPGRGIDAGRGTTRHRDSETVLDGLVDLVADEGGYLVLYAHDIADAGEAHHVPPAKLERLLARGNERGVRFLGVDDLPAVG